MPVNQRAPHADDWKPNPGPQSRFLSLTCFEALYGGSAGGGKSDSILVDAIRYVGKGYGAAYQALLLRTTFPALEKSLILRSHELYPRIGGVYNESKKTWIFPGKERVVFGYLERDADVDQYQGAAFQFCVAAGTPVLLADGSWRAIELIAVGDMVATLVGPRRVTQTFAMGRKPVVRVTGPAGTALVSASHRMLSSHGWASPEELRPTRCCASGNSASWSTLPSRRSCTPDACSPSGLPQGLECGPLSQPETIRPEIAACSADGQSDCAGYCGSRQVSSRPLGWTTRLALFAPVLRSMAPDTALSTPPDAPRRARDVSSPPDSPGGCRCDCDCDGERSRLAQVGDRVCIPSQAGAVGPFRFALREDGLGCTRTRIREDQRTPIHPYTSRTLELVEGVQPQTVEMVPEGEAEVHDLRVEQASHYVTWGGFISQNCGFDELTQFSLHQYLYLFSRCRSAHGIPCRIRGTTNPGGNGHEWVFNRFGAWLDPGSALRAAPGKVLYFVKRNGEDVSVSKGTLDDDGTPALGRVFVPARLSDNPYLASDGQYARSLRELDPVRQAQLLDGNWLIKPGKGLYFRRAWTPIVDAAPIKSTRVRYWDRAATVDGDWTAGVLMARGPDGVFYIENVVRLRGTPRDVIATIKTTAQLDGTGVLQVLEQDPGQAGVVELDMYTRELIGHRFKFVRPTGDKVTRFGPFSSQCEAGNVRLVAGPWNRLYCEELESFPEGDHDDQCDASSGAFGSIGLAMPALASTPGRPRRSLEGY